MSGHSTPENIEHLLRQVKASAENNARYLGDALTAARNIRDRAFAAQMRGLRDEDLDYMRDQADKLRDSEQQARPRDTRTYVADLLYAAREED